MCDSIKKSQKYFTLRIVEFIVMLLKIVTFDLPAARWVFINHETLISYEIQYHSSC